MLLFHPIKGSHFQDLIKLTTATLLKLTKVIHTKVHSCYVYTKGLITAQGTTITHLKGYVLPSYCSQRLCLSVFNF